MAAQPILSGFDILGVQISKAAAFLWQKTPFRPQGRLHALYTRFAVLALACLLLLLLTGTATAQGQAPQTPPPGQANGLAAPQPPADRPKKLVILGDSLSAGYLLPAADAYPAQLARALRTGGIDLEVINAGVSGDTASAGLERLDWSVEDGTSHVVLALGANDALRLIDPAITEAALEAAIMRLKARGIRVFLVGMLAPRNNGAEYTAKFDALYPRLAAKHGLPLYAFFLDGVLGNTALTLPDGMHPNKAGVATMVARTLAPVMGWLNVP